MESSDQQLTNQSQKPKYQTHMRPKILCVDDELDNLDALERLFRPHFTVLRASSGADAIKLLESHQDEISVIITDQRMPQMTGVQLLSFCLQNYPDIIRILLTGYTDVQSIVDAVNSGQIYRYLTKPWDPVDLTTTCQRAAERYYLQLELRQKNMELQKALTELQTLDKAKNQFMILINHELKTPLTSILSFTDLLKETRLDEEQEICVNRVKRSAERLQALINDSLIVVSQETNTLKIKKSKTLVSDLIPKINAELEQSLRSKNQKIDFQLASVFTLADAPMIQQVLSRLVHNACKFGKENSKIIVSGQVADADYVDNNSNSSAATIRESRPKTQSRPEIIFQVINEGPPLKTSVIEKITKPFFLDEDVMNHSVGYGLGLTVCQSLLQAHQSQLEFTNTDGGVQVQFRLPLID